MTTIWISEDPRLRLVEAPYPMSRQSRHCLDMSRHRFSRPWALPKRICVTIGVGYVHRNRLL